VTGPAVSGRGRPETTKIIDGEPARLLEPGQGNGTKQWYQTFGSKVCVYAIGPDKPEVYQLHPSGRFRVCGTVKVAGTGQICKNGWIDKEGNVISTEK